MIHFDHVSKHYGVHPALVDFSLHIPKGQIVGLLGQNGAGKSTAMNILTGCLSPSSGSVQIGAHDILTSPREAKRHMAYLPEHAPLYDEMTVFAYLVFVCRLREVAEDAIAQHVQSIAAHTGIQDVTHRKIGNLSKGFRQRVAFAQALCGDPEVIVLDEPTAGLDPVQAAEFRELIKVLGGKHTVLFSSHILSDIQAVCDRVVILHRGKLLADRMLKGGNEAALQLRAVIAMSEKKLLPALRTLKSLERAEVLPGSENGCTHVLITARSGAPIEKELFTLLSALQAPIMRLSPASDSLEELFLHATLAD